MCNWRRSSRRRETSKRSPKQRFPASGSSVGRSGLATSASPRSKSKPRRIKNFRCPIVGEVLLTRFRKSPCVVTRPIGICISKAARQASISGGLQISCWRTRFVIRIAVLDAGCWMLDAGYKLRERDAQRGEGNVKCYLAAGPVRADCGHSQPELYRTPGFGDR